jgi:tRNA(fMet)-specific endonuclease VapC
LPEDAGKIYGTIRAALAANGTLIGPNDLWISAHAMASGLTVVTSNEREFSRVKGLRVEKWAK